MPLRWKKGKIGRVWRLASDLRSKRRGSLVVQTGFPTSLADLIVKNRSRLKKSSRKTVDSPPPFSPSSSSSRFSEITVVRSFCDESAIPLIAEGIEEVEVIAKDGHVEAEVIAKDGHVEPCTPVRSFTVIFQLFALMILALGTKRLAIGITAGAFALLFFEFLGKYAISFLRSRADAPRSLKSFVRQEKVERLETRLKEAVVEGGLDLDKGSRFLCQENLTIGSDFDPSGSQRRCHFAGSDWKTEVSVNDSPRKRTSSADFRAKLWKKFRRSKGGKDGKECRLDLDSNSEVSGGGEAQKEEQEQDGEEQEGNDDHDDEDEFCSLDGYPEFDLEDIDVTAANACNPIKDNLGPLVFFVMIPFGLAGGRVLAIVLVVVWYLLVRLAETAWRNLATYRRGSLL